MVPAQLSDLCMDMYRRGVFAEPRRANRGARVCVRACMCACARARARAGVCACVHG